MSTKRRVDPILNRPVPLLFAHRGGAGEVPESTEAAFRHAVDCGADVLELDVRVTRDGEMIVWHGPGLGNVHDGNRFFSEEDHICEFRWSDLRGRAWVAGPNESVTVQRPDRLLLSLGEFFKLVNHVEDEKGLEAPFSRLAVNIELKPLRAPAPGWAGKDHSGQAIIDKLLDMVGQEQTRRRLILASVDHRRLCLIRRRLRRRSMHCPTNLSWIEQTAFSEYIQNWRIRLGFALADVVVPEREDLADLAFETSYGLVGRKLVREVHRRGGSIYAFLTGFPLIPGMDQEGRETLEPKLFKLLDSGVDGVMTDYPAKIQPMMERWKQAVVKSSTTDGNEL